MDSAIQSKLPSFNPRELDCFRYQLRQAVSSLIRDAHQFALVLRQRIGWVREQIRRNGLD
jgi:hypothetical protein